MSTKVVGIIAEYNPFHNGHAYQIAKAKELTGAGYAVIIMSGNFVQRGAPAFADKYTRTNMALAGGADLVLELPVCYATASGDYFAEGAVAILDRLGVITHLCFGSESGDICLLEQTAELLATESGGFSACLQTALKSGISYAKAIEQAVLSVAGYSLPAGFLSAPNHLLGLSYLKALKRRGSRIQGVTIKRTGQPYHDTAVKTDGFSSAAAIRSVLTENAAFGSAPADNPILRAAIPSVCLPFLLETLQYNKQMDKDDFSAALGYALLHASYADYLDISADLSNRIHNLLPEYRSFSQFAGLLKNKSTTFAAISRGLLHILLNIKKSDMKVYQETDWVQAVRILGFRKESAPLLSAIKKNSTLTLISKLADYKSCTAQYPTAKKQLEQTLSADALYRMTVMEKTNIQLPTEFQHPICIL